MTDVLGPGRTNYTSLQIPLCLQLGVRMSSFLFLDARRLAQVLPIIEYSRRLDLRLLSQLCALAGHAINFASLGLDPRGCSRLLQPPV
jgi:hypothetical protein